MGMSASQARLLSLEARQSNLEYQGQQINQERTILSQQCTSLYNSLLAMTVPTPPSTQDYTTVQYTGENGATNFTLGTVKPSGDAYNVEIITTQTGDSIDATYGSYAVSSENPTLTVANAETTEQVGTGNYNLGSGEAPTGNTPYMKKATNSELKDGDIVYTLEDGKFMKNTYNSATMSNKELYLYATDGKYNAEVDKILGEEITEPKPISIKNPDDYIVEDSNAEGGYRYATAEDFDKQSDGTYTFKNGVKYFKEVQEGQGTTIKNPNEGRTTVGGEVCYTFEEAKNLYPDMSWGRYESAIKNKFGQNSEENGKYNLSTSEFLVYFTKSDSGKPVPHFVVESDTTDGDGFAKSYDYTANGTYTTSEPKEGCKLQFDAQGRITTISIPTYNSNNEIISYTDIELKASTVTDNAAYQDAYNQYEYAQYEYDKKQQEINAKTEVIQQQDRNLELKLQRLDNERTQITTEIEAVKKVINDNIEGSYKTFSG